MKRLLFVLGTVSTLAFAAALPAAVVHRTDETAVAGQVVGLENGKVIVSTPSPNGAGQRVEVPLEEVVEINFDPDAPAPAPAAPAPAAPGQSVAQAAPPPAVPGSNRKGVSAHFYNAQFWKSPRPAGGAIGAGRSPGDAPPDAALTAQDELVILAAPDVSTTLPTLSNHFGEAPPAEGLNKDSVSAAFSGRIRPKVSGEYTFLCRSDDDHWLLVDGKLVCSDPGAHGARDPREGSRPDTVIPVKLEAGKDYHFLFLANEGLVDFTAIAQWIPPGESEPQDIPEDCLFAETGPPAAPSELKASPAGDTTVTLSFRDVATSEIRYQVDRATDPGFVNSVAVGTAPINASKFVDKDLAPGVTYHYRVRAVNFEGSSPPVVVAARTGGGAGQPALAAAELPAVPRGDKKGVTAQFFNGQYWRSPNPMAAGVRARDGADAPADAPPGDGAPAAPSAPAPVVITAPPDASTTLPTLNNNFAEEAPHAGIARDDVSAAFTGRIRPKETGEYTFVCTTDDDHWLFVNGRLVCSDPGPHGARDAREGEAPETIVPIRLEAGKDYDFVFLVNEGGRDFTCHAQWIPPGGSELVEIPEDCLFAQTGAPAAPTDLRVAETTDTGVTLAFKDNSTSEVRFSVERDLSPSFLNPAPAGSVPINGDKFVDKELRKGVTYYYRLRAVNFDGRSTPVTIAATPGVPVAQQQAVAAANAAKAPQVAAAPAPAAAMPAPGDAVPAAARQAAAAPAPVKNEKGVSARYFAAQFWKSSDPRAIGGEVTVIGEPDVVTTVPSLTQEWEEGSPDPKLANDRFSTAYFGKLRTGAAGAYTFLGFSDDDHYLYVNGQLVSIDTGPHGSRDPRAGSDREKIKPIELAANTEYDFLYLHNENIGGAAASVLWIPPGSESPAEIPEDNLRTATGVPAAPSELAADASAGNEVKLTFKDVATNEIRYVVERAGDANFTSQKVVNYLPINATSHTDPTVTKGNVYFYRLTAVNFEGPGAPVVIQVTAGEKAGTAIAMAPAQGGAPAAKPAGQPAAPAVTFGNPDADGFVSLFNGKDFTGWDGDTQKWTVEDGAITAHTTEENRGSPSTSTWLVWKGGDVADFELRLKYKVVGVNSGVNYRSKVVDNKSWQVRGYQADIEDTRPISGTLWEDPPGRGTLAGVGEKVTWRADGGKDVENIGDPVAILEAVNHSDWNDYVITAVGKKLTHQINGVTTSEVIDESEQASATGVIALQYDRYLPGSTQFKDIRLKVLGGQRPAGIAAAPQPAPAAPQGPQGPQWTVLLAGGDRLTGAVSKWDGKQVVLNGDAGEVAVPVRRLREAWRESAEAAEKAKALVAPGTLEDTALVRAENNEVRAVAGVALGVDGDSLNFRFNDRDRKIALDRLVGVVFGESDEAKADPFGGKFHQSLLLASGDTLSGLWVGLAGGVLELRTPWEGKVSVPVEKVARLKSRNGGLVYLSDLTPAKVEQVPYFDRMLAFRADQSLTGSRLKLADGEYDKGLAVHSRCLLHYDVGGSYGRFKAKVGFQDPEGKAGNAHVRVLADGKPLFDRPDARGDAPPEELDLDVTGVKTLTLEVDFGRGQDVGDRVVWANPRLLKSAGKK